MSNFMHKRCTCGRAFTTRMPSRDKCEDCVNFYSIHHRYPVEFEAPCLTEEQCSMLAAAMSETVTQLGDGTPVFHYGTEKIDA